MKNGLPAYVYRRRNGQGTEYHYFERNGLRVRVDPSAPDFWQTYA